MPGSLRESAEAIRSLFTQIDRSVSNFQSHTGLHCPLGCGRCCLEDEVYTTELELLPAAFEIVEREDLSIWEERLREADAERICLFYRTAIAPSDGGHCGFYNYRPAICRMFAFASVRGRLGDNAMSLCKTIKQTDPEGVAAAAIHRNEAPCLSDIGTRVFAVDPVLGSRLMPINEAITKALERVGLHMRFSGRQTIATHSRL